MLPCHAPIGKMPLAVPGGDEGGINKRGIGVSPKDVPGCDQDRYMPDSMKDKNGRAYARRDAAGNY